VGLNSRMFEPCWFDFDRKRKSGLVVIHCFTLFTVRKNAPRCTHLCNIRKHYYVCISIKCLIQVSYPYLYIWLNLSPSLLLTHIEDVMLHLGYMQQKHDWLSISESQREGDFCVCVCVCMCVCVPHQRKAAPSVSLMWIWPRSEYERGSMKAPLYFMSSAVCCNVSIWHHCFFFCFDIPCWVVFIDSLQLNVQDFFIAGIVCYWFCLLTLSVLLHSTASH